MPIVPVKLKANGKEIITYAMLDNCSTGTFVQEDLSKELEVVGAETNLVIKTINGTEFHNTTVFMDLVVSDMDGGNSIKLQRTYTRKEIPRPEWIKSWSHLHRIVDDVPVFLPDVEIGLLIGSNCPKAIEPKDLIVGDHGEPSAVKTFAGWTVIGPIQKVQSQTQVNCHRIIVKEVDSNRLSQHYFTVEDKVKDIITPKDLNRLLYLEFNTSRSSNDSGLSR